MPHPESSSPGSLREAGQIFAAWLKERRSDTGNEVDRLCALHPGLAPELRQLHAAFQLGQTAAASRSFQAAVCARFANAETITVRLEEGFASQQRGQTGVEAVSKAATSATHGSSRYTLEDEVARGGMGVIWRVRDHDLSRTLAMKVMSSELDQSAASEATPRIHLARFLEEAHVTAQLDHPGIVPVHEVGFDAGGQPFFTMKLVKGRDLNEIFKLAREEKEDWNLPRAVGLMVKACQAMAYAHTKGVIHRDLKPPNIMVGRFGEVFVMDWGIAKITGRKDLHDIRLHDHAVSATIRSERRDSESTPDSPLITMDGSVVGTPAYMPPEQARGEVEAVDQVSDIYSLGAILYNLLTGQPPYVEPGMRISPHTILARVLDGPPKRVHQINRQAPPELIAICEKAMAREKCDRYGSSLDLAEDLQAFLDNRVVRAHRTGPVAEFTSWVSRNKGLASVAATAALLVVLAATGFIIQQKRANLEQRNANARLRLNAYAADMKAAQSALQQNSRGQAVELLNQYWPKPGEKDLRGVEWRYLWQAARGDEVHTWTHPGMVPGARFSPDGKRVASACFDGSLRVWDVASRKLALQFNRGVSDEGVRISFCYSPDGRTLASASRDGIVLLDSASGRVVRTLEFPARDLGFVRDLPLTYSANGRWLAAGIGQVIGVWNTETWEATRLPQAVTGRLAFAPDNITLAMCSSRGGEIVLWNVLQGSRVGALKGMGYTFTLAVSPGNDLLAAGNTTGEIGLWDLRTGQQVWTNRAHGSPIYGLAFSHDGRRLASGGFDQVVHLWDVAAREKLKTLHGHLNEIWSVEFSPDDRSLVTSSKDGTVKLWDALSEPQPGQWWLDENEWPLGFAPDGRRLITVAERGRTLRHWDGARPTKAMPIDGALNKDRAVFLPKSMSVFAGNTNGEIRVHSVETGRMIRSIKVAEQVLRLYTVSPDERWLTGWDRAVSNRPPLSVWDGATGETVARFPDFHGSSSSYQLTAFSPDSRLLALATTNDAVKVWDIAERREVRTLGRHAWRVYAVTFSADGKYLASSSWEGDARVFEVASGREIVAPLRGHGSGVHAVSFSPNATTLLTAGDDFTVRFWHVPTGREMLVLNNASHKNSRTPFFSPTGERFVLWDNTRKSARVERIPTLAEIDSQHRQTVKDY